MKNNKLTTILSSSELILGFVLLFIMFTTPIVTNVMLHVKLDISMDQANQWEQLSGTTVAYAFIKAMLLEFLVMVLLVNGYKKTSIGFTLTTGIVSLYCFNQFSFSEGVPKLSIEVIYAFMFPLVTAICSHIYIERKQKEQDQSTETNRIESETIGKLEETNRIQEEQIRRLNKINGKQSDELNEKSDEIQLVQESLEEVFAQSEKMRKNNRKSEREIRRITESQKEQSDKLRSVSVDAQRWKEATTCKHCGHSVKSPQGLNSHQAKCKSNPKNIEKGVEQLDLK